MAPLNYLFAFSLLFIFSSPYGISQPGSLDPDFGVDGRVLTKLGVADIIAEAITLQKDGKILVVGYSINQLDPFVVLSRWLPDGSLDTDFGDDGRIIIDYEKGYQIANRVALQSDGKILMLSRISAVDEEIGFDGGSWVVNRFLTNGTPDETFGTAGQVSGGYGEKFGWGFDMAIQADDKIVIVGPAFDMNIFYHSYFAVTRLLPDGDVDLEFGQGGWLITEFNEEYAEVSLEVSIQPDGKILALGWCEDGPGTFGLNIAVARYLSDGSLDVDFGDHGKVLTHFNNRWIQVSEMALQHDGKIVMVGEARRDFDDSINNQDFFMARLLTDGSADPEFGSEGVVYSKLDVNSMFFSTAVQADGRIVGVGTTIFETTDSLYYYEDRKFLVSRHLQDGSPDPEFGDNGIVITEFEDDYNVARAVAIQQDGKIIVAGYANYPEDDLGGYLAIVRYLTETTTGVFDRLHSNIPIRVYPNPATNIATLAYRLDDPEIIAIDIIDAQGQILRNYQSPRLQLAGKYQLPIITSGLSAGLYSIVIHTPKGKQTVKIVKQ